MKFFVTVKARAKVTKVERLDPQHFKVSVKEPPIEGKANEAVLRALAEYFNVSFSQMKLVSGQTSKYKVIELF